MFYCPEGEKAFELGESLDQQVRQEVAALNQAIAEAMAAIARRDFGASGAALARASQAAAAVDNLQIQAEAAFDQAAAEFKKCAERAFERGYLRDAINLFRAARACGAVAAEADELADQVYKTSERTLDDGLKPAARDPMEPIFPPDPATIVTGDEQTAAARDEEDSKADGLTPAQRVVKLTSAANHHRAAARHERVLGDRCVAADELAAAADDYSAAAAIMIEAGDPDSAFQLQLEAAILAEEAARLYESCAADADAQGRRRPGVRFRSKADTCWERVWLFWDRMRRYWQVRRMKARDEGDPNEETYRRNAEEARKKAAEADKAAVDAREKLEEAIKAANSQ